MRRLGLSANLATLNPKPKSSAVAPSRQRRGPSAPKVGLIGRIRNGAATLGLRVECVWLPLAGGNAIPIAAQRANRWYAVHTDHLGTPRQLTDDTAKPVWHWP